MFPSSDAVQVNEALRKPMTSLSMGEALTISLESLVVAENSSSSSVWWRGQILYRTYATVLTSFRNLSTRSTETLAVAKG